MTHLRKLTANRGKVMRILLVTALTAAAYAAPSYADQAADALVQKAEACIRSGADRVAINETYLEDGVNFLVNSLCAVQVQRSNSYELSALQLAAWRSDPATPDLGSDPAGLSDGYKKGLIDKAARSNALLAQVTINPNTGELVTPLGFDPPTNGATILSMSRLRNGLATDAHFRALAAESILAARGSHARRHP